MVVGSDWLSSGPGVIAVIGIALTAATFLVNVWAAWRRDKREQMVAEAKLRAIDNMGSDTDPIPLDPAPLASRKKPQPD